MESYWDVSYGLVNTIIYVCNKQNIDGFYLLKGLMGGNLLQDCINKK